MSSLTKVLNIKGEIYAPIQLIVTVSWNSSALGSENFQENNLEM